MGRLESSSPAPAPTAVVCWRRGGACDRESGGYVEGIRATWYPPVGLPLSAAGSEGCSAAPGSEASPPGPASPVGVKRGWRPRARGPEKHSALGAVRGRGQGGAGLFPRLLLGWPLTSSYSSTPQSGLVPPWSPSLPQPAGSPRFQAKLTFRGGGCISAPAQAASRLRNSRKPRPHISPAPVQLRPRPAHAWSVLLRGKARGGRRETKPLLLLWIPRKGSSPPGGRPVCRTVGGNLRFLCQDSWVLFLVGSCWLSP